MDFTRKQSEFNLSLNYLNLILGHMYECATARMEMNPNKWYQALKSWYSFIITSADNIQKDKIRNINDNIRPLINDYIRNMRNELYPKIDSKLYEYLEEYQNILMEILEKGGLLLKMKESPEFAMQNANNFA